MNHPAIFWGFLVSRDMFVLGLEFCPKSMIDVIWLWVWWAMGWLVDSCSELCVICPLWCSIICWSLLLLISFVNSVWDCRVISCWWLLSSTWLDSIAIETVVNNWLLFSGIIEMLSSATSKSEPSEESKRLSSWIGEVVWVIVSLLLFGNLDLVGKIPLSDACLSIELFFLCKSFWISNYS